MSTNLALSPCGPLRPDVKWHERHDGPESSVHLIDERLDEKSRRALYAGGLGAFFSGFCPAAKISQPASPERAPLVR